jgi:EAL domain-containing protein (putative c-di-GMP-specific phosphodiesterase class I)
MSIEKSVLEKLLKLPADKQKEVLDFVETLEKKARPTHRRRSLKGLWADLGVEVSSEDIAAARREMWGGFPREDV